MFLFNAATLLLYTTTAQTLIPNAADVELQGNITMTVSANQNSGACWPGYLWNVQYGSCRRMELEQQTEYTTCPTGYSGQQTRLSYRYNHIAQVNGHIASDPWVYDTWNNSQCITTPTWNPTEIPIENRIPESIQIDYAHGTNFGANAIFYAYLMLHRSTGILWCYATIESTESGKTVYEYPKEGIYYSQSNPSHQMHQCQIRGDTVDFGGINTGYGTITRTAVSNDGCMHYFNRTGIYGPYPTPFSNTVRAC